MPSKISTGDPNSGVETVMPNYRSFIGYVKKEI